MPTRWAALKSAPSSWLFLTCSAIHPCYHRTSGFTIFVSKGYRFVRLVLSILMLGVVSICGVVFILPEFQPTALQQLLRLTDLPQDLKLSPENPGPWGSHDFTIVQQALLQKVPLGSD